MIKLASREQNEDPVTALPHQGARDLIQQAVEAELSEYMNALKERRLDKDQWVYICAVGVYSGLRSQESKLCVLVIIGVNERGQKRFLAIDNGVRVSTQSWRRVRGFDYLSKVISE